MSHSWARASHLLPHSSRSRANLGQDLPHSSEISSLHRFLCSPALLFPFRGIHSVILLDHLSSPHLARCPAQDHFRFLALPITSVIFVSSLMALFRHLSFLVIPNILLSMALWYTCSFLPLSAVSDQVWAPYVIVGNINESKSFFFRLIGRSPFIHLPTLQ